MINYNINKYHLHESFTRNSFLNMQNYYLISREFKCSLD